MLKYILLFILGGLVFTTACAPVTTESNPNIQQSPTPQTATPASATEPDMATPELSAGEVPQAIFDSVLADLLAVATPDNADVTVVKSEMVIWSDGSLGCPQPDVMYTQALVEGYQVIFAVGDKLYDYHISDSGYFVLCENAISTGIVEGTPTQ